MQLCQEYGITDAAAFLLERVGDVGSALLLTLSSLSEKFEKLDAAIIDTTSEVTRGDSYSLDHFSAVLRMEEVCAFYLFVLKFLVNFYILAH